MASWNQREKEEIEYRISCVKKFLEMWVRYDELFQMAHTEKEISQEHENEFFKLKGQMARRHQYLLEYLGKEYGNGKAEPITSYLSDTVTLHNMKDIHFDFFKKLRLQWHATFLLLNEALGYLMTHLELERPLEN
jgi:hypothetical protein